MSHTPPIPQGNQSPYPLQEPPHAAATAPASAPDLGTASDIAIAPERPAAQDADGAQPTDMMQDLPLAAIGVAVGLGAALIGGVLIGLRRGKPKSGGRSKRRT